MRRWTMARKFREKQFRQSQLTSVRRAGWTQGACTHSFDEPQKQQGNVLMERLRCTKIISLPKTISILALKILSPRKTLSLWKRDGWSPYLLKIFWLTCSRLPPHHSDSYVQPQLRVTYVSMDRAWWVVLGLDCGGPWVLGKEICFSMSPQCYFRTLY